MAGRGTIWAKGFLSLSLLFGEGALPAPSSGDAPPPLPVENRTLHMVADQQVDVSAPLTKDEQALARAFFGPGLNPALIVKHRHQGNSPTTAAITRNLNDIIFYRDFWSEEFTRESAFNFGNFMHEVTHIWQHQTRFKGPPGHGDYELRDVPPGRRFTDFHAEYQGVLVEDYVRRFLHPDHQYRRIRGTPENDAALQRVVEEQFPGARRLRLDFETRGRLVLARNDTAGQPPAARPTL